MISLFRFKLVERTGPTIVAAREHGETQIRNIVVCGRSCLGTTNWALGVRVTNCELIVVSGKRLQAFCFDLVNC
jgi:hypothetical protein